MLTETHDALQLLAAHLAAKERGGPNTTVFIPDACLREIIVQLDEYTLASLRTILTRPDIEEAIRTPHIDTPERQVVRRTLKTLESIRENVLSHSRGETTFLIEINQAVLARILRSFSALSIDTLNGMLQTPVSPYLQQYANYNVLYAGAGLRCALLSLKQLEGRANVADPRCATRPHSQGNP
jgi:hypothetical protein